MERRRLGGAFLPLLPRGFLAYPRASMNEREFLSDPEAAIASEAEIPSQWVGRAWREHEEFRENVVYYLAQSISGDGTFNSASAWMRLLPQALTAEEAAHLYAEVLEQSHRLELEWRPAFIRAFPAAEELLPDPVDVPILAATLEQQIGAGYEEGFEDTVRRLAALPGGTNELQSLIALAEEMKRTAMASTLRQAAKS
jgi:hypothetical protein